MPLRQHLADIHGYHTGEKGDNRAIPAAIIQLTKAGAGKTDHKRHQPARITQRAELAKAFFHAFVIQQTMFREDNDMLNLRDDVHINAAITVLRVDVRHCPSLMVVRTMALEEIALSTLSIPSAKPRRVESSSTSALSAPCCNKAARIEYITVLLLVELIALLA